MGREGQACSGCGRPLSRYNADRYCQSCRNAGASESGWRDLGAGDWTPELAARLRELRKRRGITQAVLADFAGMSPGLLSMIETGSRPLRNHHHVTGLAAALRVPVSDIIPGLDRPTARSQADQQGWRGSEQGGRQTAPGIADLQKVLLGSYLSAHPDHSARHGHARSLAGLRGDLEAAFSAFQGSRYATAAGRAAVLLTDAERAAGECSEPERPRAQELLALAYQAAATVLVKVGEPDLGWIAAERGLNSANASGNAIVRASLCRSVAFSLLASGRLEAAMRTVESSAGRLKEERTGGATALSVYGMLFLAGAMAAARSGDSARTADYLQEADAAARRLGRNANHLWTAFGPTNVAIHRVNTAVELGDFQAVRRTSLALNTSAVPAERRVRYLLDVARIHSLTGSRDDAARTMLLAERMAPEQVRQHHLSHQVVLRLVRNSMGKPPAELRGLARRVGVCGPE